MRLILRDLYGWTEPITATNWRKLDTLIRERSADPSWPRQILNKATIRRAGTELWRRKDGSADDIFQYALEWAFFARAQWGVYDTPLYELETAWNQPDPGALLPVTLGSDRPAVARPIRTLDDVHAAVDYYVDHIPYSKILSTAQHISTDIDFRETDDADMAMALSHRDRATTEEQNIYASYILELFLTKLESHINEIVFQFSLGAEPLPFETGSKLRQETIFQVASIVARHPNVRFMVFLSSEHTNQSMCTLTRELPNLSLAGYWWHNFFPSTIRSVLSERLDMMAANKQIGFFSDAYCLDWAYAKAVLVRKQMAAVLAGKVDQDQYSIDTALEIARQVCYESPQSLLGMVPHPGSF